MKDLTIVFDLDGTLIDTAPDLIGGINRVLAAEGQPTAPAHVMQSEISLGSRKMIEAALAHNGVSLSGRDVERIFQAFLKHYAENIAVESKPFAHLDRVIADCSAAGATLAVCTNKREELAKLLLDKLDMSRHFRAIAGWNTFPVMKPDPAHLIGTIEMAGGDPKRSVMVGDSETDILTAKAAGIPVIAVTFGYTHRPVHEFGPDVVIGSYAEFASALARVRPRSRD